MLAEPLGGIRSSEAAEVALWPSIPRRNVRVGQVTTQQAAIRSSFLMNV